MMNEHSDCEQITPESLRVLPSIWHERMLALSGIGLSAICVQQLARRGEVVPDDHSQTLLNSLLETEPRDTLSVYQTISALHPALRMLRGHFDGQGPKDIEQTRYMIGLLTLERRLAKNNPALHELARGLTQIKRQRDEFHFEPHRIIEHLGKLYSDVISPIGPRIQVNGKPEYLQKIDVQHHIRAMLLAGIRSAVLWRQLGGKRRHIIFSRRKLQQAMDDLLRYESH